MVVVHTAEAITTSISAAAFSFILGVLTSLVASLIWQEHGHRIVARVKRLRVRRRTVPPPTGFLRLGAVEIPWVVVCAGAYRRDDLDIHWDARPGKLHPVVQKLYGEQVRAAEAAARRGEPAPFNGLGYKLEAFFAGMRRGPDEQPVLTLRFRPTDYFAMLVTDQALDRPVVVDGELTTLRRLFAHAVDLAVRPVPELATHFGIALQVVTADGQTVFALRGQTAVDAHVWFPSVAEGASRPTDAGPRGGPDPYRTAVRGLVEELGVDVPEEDILFLSFGANAVLCEYALCGLARIRETAEQVARIRATGVPKDKWESQSLRFVRWTPREVARFVAEQGPWSPFALVTVYHALIHDFGREATDRAFSAVKRVNLSQTLPG